jgi:predicted RNA binding protein YcfA (HicA-like mRNA interferase family)
MSKLPRVSGSDLVAAFKKVGFQFIRQHGSHMILRRHDPFAQVTIPNHRELDRGTLRPLSARLDSVLMN